jgi:F-type H+-transporting ATPase subunit b
MNAPCLRRNIRFSFFVALTMILLAPFCHAVAQQTTPAAGPTSAAQTSQGTPASSQPAGQSDSDEEYAFLHPPIVRTMARALHLGEDTTVVLLLGINFGIIFLCIVIPLSRAMPKIMRSRSQVLRHDLEAARKATAEAQSRLSAVEAKLAGLGEEMQKFRAQIEQEALEDEKRIKAALAEESARIVTAAEQEIHLAAAQAKRGLRVFAADLAIEQASKQVALTPETDRALISEFVAGVNRDAKGGQN